MIRFFMVYLYWIPHFLHWINSLGTQKKKKLRLDWTHGTKLNSNWNPIFTPN